LQTDADRLRLRLVYFVPVLSVRKLISIIALRVQMLWLKVISTVLSSSGANEKGGGALPK